MTRRQRKRKKKLQIRNKRLVKQYDFLLPRNVWTDKVPKGYDFSYIDWGWSDGWDKAFGMQYLKELGEAVKESKNPKAFRITQIKEKYGSARCYTNWQTEKIGRIIDKYEVISEHICFRCGVEAPMVDTGWILPQCCRCFIKNYRRNEAFYNGEESPKTDEELVEMYNSLVYEKPDADGKWRIPTSYRIRKYSAGVEIEEIIDISDTVERIRKRQAKWIRK